MSAANKVTFNWQMGVILALTLLMLIAPVTGVVLFAKGYFDARRQRADAAEVPGLREKIESAADATLPPKPLDDERPVLEIRQAADAREKFLKDHVVNRPGVSSLELEPNVRYLVSGPGGTAEALARAAQLKNPPELPAGDEFFEILFIDPQ